MGAGDLLRSAWNVYTLHWKTIVTIFFFCAFLPSLISYGLAVGLAHQLGLMGTFEQYTLAVERYRELVFDMLLSSRLVDPGALDAQKLVVNSLQAEVAPLLHTQTVLNIIVMLIYFLGMLALLRGFYGKFGSASTLLREAHKRYLGFLGTLCAYFLGLILLAVVLGLGLALVILLVQLVGSSSGAGLVLETLGGILLVILGVYVLLGLSFALYECAHTGKSGFTALRISWMKVQGKRWTLLGQCLLAFFILGACMLPLFLVQLFFELGTFGVLKEGMDTVISLVISFVFVPVWYLFLALLYKRL
jgi:hypothetical protein